MHVVITAVGPDNRGLADPIIHYVTGQGANIAEIQMYDHDEASVFAMLIRIHLAREQFEPTKKALEEIGRLKKLAVRVWSPDERRERPRLAICTTYRPEPALALLRAIRDQQIAAEPAVIIGNRPNCRGLAEQFGVDWHEVGDAAGKLWRYSEAATLWDGPRSWLWTVRETHYDLQNGRYVSTAYKPGRAPAQLDAADFSPAALRGR